MAYRSLLFVASIGGVLSSSWQPCIELKRELSVPCECSLSPEHRNAVRMNCDEVILTRDANERLKQQPIVWFSQTNAGYKSLPEELINLALPLEKLDLSGNSIQRLMDRLLRSQNRLKELRLADNLLGDNLNPIFSSNEFHGMNELRILDLGKNGLRSIEEGIFKGCTNLEALYLDDNNLTSIPAASLKGPAGIKLLSLANNNIGSVTRDAFNEIGGSLEGLDLSYNDLSYMEDEAFADLGKLIFLNVSGNDLTRFNSDVFKGAASLSRLDLSVNYLTEFPSVALRHLEELTFLNLSHNLIGAIEQKHFAGLITLQTLDLSRNNIARLGVNAFSGLSSLVHLNLSLNALRTIEESSFEGLTNLEYLSLQDNNILLVPASALSRLPSLTHLHIEYNRVAALSMELLRFGAPTLETLGLSRNLIREIPSGIFDKFQNLIDIDLCGNMLLSLPSNTFDGLEESLETLDLSYNRLTMISEMALNGLTTLNLAGNFLRRVSPESFKFMTNLKHLNLSSNPLYGGFPPIFPSSLASLDISYTGLKILPSILFLNLKSLEKVSLRGNSLVEISEGTFQDLYNLSSIDLSRNGIENIEKEAFVNLINLYRLNLRGNKLASFGGEFFNTGTGLHVLDLSDNLIGYLSPTAFVIHPRLQEINLSRNRFAYFPSDFAKPLQFLKKIDLSYNMLVKIDEFAFSRISRLRCLDLSNNKIATVDELPFHNSTQLQIVSFADNELEILSERTMEGMLRLEHLDMSNNKLRSLPETIFDPSRIGMLESIDLSGNKFHEIPSRALQKQAGSLYSLNMANNALVEVFDQEIINVVKELDLSGNPLGENTMRGILGEAKILRSLSLANTGITGITRLETPFLQRLNISGNNISDLSPATLERATLLEDLDISKNNITDLTNLIRGFQTLPVLGSLDISSNGVKTINESSFSGLDALRELRINDLPKCNRIERSAFKKLGKLRVLRAYDYPRLGYFDVQGILRDMKNLETIDVEIKDSSVGNEQLSLRSHPRVTSVTLRGDRLRNIQSSLLVGVRNSELFVGLKNTSIDSITAALFFPVPRSTRVTLDVSGSRFATFSQPLVAALEERRGTVDLRGLDEIPLRCDCEALQLWHWLTTSRVNEGSETRCFVPEYLRGRNLAKMKESELTCDETASTKFLTTEGRTTVKSTMPEPDIIWTVAPTTRDKQNPSRVDSAGAASGNNTATDDTLVIGIVGGVFAFIVIVVILICICRLRWNNRTNETRDMGPMASSIHEASVVRPGSTYSGKANHDFYGGGSYNGSTLGHRNNVTGSPIHTPVPMMPLVQPMQIVQQIPRPGSQPVYGYFENPALPVYMTYSTDGKYDR